MNKNKLISKAHGLLKTKAAKLGMVATAVGTSAAMFANSASAADPSGIDTSAIQTALTSGLNSAATQTVSCMALVAPYGLTVFVAMLVVTYAKKFFSKISSTHG